MDEAPVGDGSQSADAAASITPPEAHAALARVLASATFANAERLARFLEHVSQGAVSGREIELKEYAVGIEVFDRPASFDPKSDSIVRVQARRLRQRLEAYYASEGSADPVVIELPKGHYTPVFSRRTPRGPATSPSASNHRAPPSRRLSRRVAQIAAIATAVLLIAAGVIATYVLRSTPRPTTLAVLPFENASDQPGTEYLCFGLVEEVSARLTRVRGLRVVARSSAEQAARDKDAAVIGKRLGADALVEGSVRRAGQRLRVAVQLVSAVDGSRLWGETYDRNLPSDLFAVQDEIADQIAHVVAARLAGQPAGAGKPSAAVTPEVRALYWQARYVRNLRTEASRLESRDLFRKVVAAAPDYAPALSALGEVCATLAFHQEAPVDQAVAEAVTALRRALELDDSIAEAHAVLGWLAFFRDWDWPAAERHFRRALELNPNQASAHQLFAMALSSRGRFDEAVSHSESAVALDPVSYAVSTDLTAILYLARRFDEGIAQARSALELNPQAHALHGALGVCLIGSGRNVEAVAEFEKVVAAFGRHSFLLARLGQAKARAGDQAAARALAAEVEAAASRGEAYYTHLAYVLAALGERDRAIDSLMKAVDRRESDIVFVGVDPAFDPLRADPRFVHVLERVGLRQK